MSLSQIFGCLFLCVIVVVPILFICDRYNNLDNKLDRILANQTEIRADQQFIISAYGLVVEKR